MQVEYKSNSIREICTNTSAVERKYGLRVAELISLRIDQIIDASQIILYLIISRMCESK